MLYVQPCGEKMTERARSVGLERVEAMELGEEGGVAYAFSAGSKKDFERVGGRYVIPIALCNPVRSFF